MGIAADLVKNATELASPLHPYYPLEVEIVGYLANEWSVLLLLGIFFGGCAVIFSLTYMIIKKVQPTMPTHEVWTVMWFVLSEWLRSSAIGCETC